MCRTHQEYGTDPKVKTVVLTDASRLHGIGFALVQVYKEKLTLIQCGSASLSPTQSRYSTVELECLAIINAIQKCHYYWLRLLLRLWLRLLEPV